MESHVPDLIKFLDASPVNFFAAEEITRRLDEAGYTRLDAAEKWDLAVMPSVTSDAASTLANVREISADLGAMSKELKELPIDTTFANIRSITERLDNVMAQLNSPNSTMGLLLNDPALYRSLNSSVASLDSLLNDVKRNPKRYISIKLL